MGARASIEFAQVNNTSVIFDGAGTNYIVETPSGVLYMVYCDIGTDVAFKKSTDGGLTWGASVVVFAGTITAISVWYDRWSNIAAGLIHIAYTESVTDDTLYRTIDTGSSDALSTQTTIFLGASTANGGCLSITRAVGGNVYCATMIDAGAEGGFFRLPNANVPNGAWDAARTTVFEAISSDQVILVPGFAADNQDIMAIFWDASADEISRKIYDDSLNTWAETSIAATMVDALATASFPHFSAAVDITNSRILVAAWSAVDLVNADLRCWTVTESAITETAANVVLNSTDDQGFTGIGIDLVTGYWWVTYGGASGGAETWRTAINLYCKVSTDSGATWGPETKLTAAADDIPWMVVCPRKYLTRHAAAYLRNATTTDDMLINVAVTQPRASHQIYGG